MILEVLNGQLAALVVLGSHGGQNIRLSICNSFECRPGSCAQWGVDKSLNAKLAGLTRWQLSCLEIWAGAFWEKHYQSCTLDEYCKTLEN
jgi:hypothetical protein